MKGQWAHSWYPDRESDASHRVRARFLDFLPRLVGLVRTTPR